ncbi:TrmJ/YjtD family RNA methyltransferase [Methanothermobacter wolfeii]|uniref:TrmJ/YjtD family RNA methyltransferase n=1 Tax=Methanothermobacter wolfeii TaxID=145261 RepID=A0A9E7UH81_METWO|nr:MULTISPECIES: TrmJ/YjtD family RNA methyltransferase [Methanothermobacter]MDI6702737.1 TrmJ/YjtD family RNA methyltransferase [Methanothermobacter wolfeii]MDI6841536.1 TrmJ/YjtD family RNA methyltransferase [Methanothermobacter wolfeii]NLM01787.1 TrmJ/YjtD family RNA methyltransferase [Methanothermobacter wolfeii]QHN05925.1 TrmJ/YjtD family RNA methyltransferase [Methanothermobacter sp. THM-1]UXH32089.1 TrmJ/YjtD family RNA methyltransferase [Methanothermobacter wolfeii]
MDKYGMLCENIMVVFVEPETPGNIGFLARTMKNFGMERLILINPCRLEDEAYYHAMHARSIVDNAEVYPSLKEMLKALNPDFLVGTTGVPGGSYNVERIPLRPSQLSESLNPSASTAILFGREGDGLSNNEIDLCDVVVSIPTSREYPIMNITHAAAIIFYEIFRGREFPCEGLEEASGLEKNLLIDEMDNVLSLVDMPEHKRRVAARVFRNILGRAFITAREAHTLKGVLRRIKNHLKDV